MQKSTEITILCLVTAKDFTYLTYTMIQGLTGRREGNERHRMEIISIRVVSGHIISMELVQEFSVTRHITLHNIASFSYGYPVYLKAENTEGFLL